MDADVWCIQCVREIGTSKQYYLILDILYFLSNFCIALKYFHSQRCPQCNEQIQFLHPVYLDLDEMRRIVARLHEFFANVAENARELQNVIEFLEQHH